MRISRKKVSRTVDDLAFVLEHDMDPKTREIYLSGTEDYIAADGSTSEPGVEYSMAKRFIKRLNLLARMSSEPILVHMKTCGGDWHEGMAIHNAIEHCPAPVVILSYTHARSMSSLIFCAADRRVMMPDSLFMFHGGTVEFSGTAKQFQTEAEQDRLRRDRMLEIYSVRLEGKRPLCLPETSFRHWLIEQMDRSEEAYFSAERAVELGFADGIMGREFGWSNLLIGVRKGDSNGSS